MTSDEHKWAYVGPALLTAEGGPEWSVLADLKTEQESDSLGIATMRSWGGKLMCGNAEVVTALGRAAVLTLPDGRQGALYCSQQRTESETGPTTTLEVVGSGPAPY